MGFREGARRIKSFGAMSRSTPGPQTVAASYILDPKVHLRYRVREGAMRREDVHPATRQGLGPRRLPCFVRDRLLPPVEWAVAPRVFGGWEGTS